MVGDFNIIIPKIYEATRKKVNEGIRNLNNNINLLDLMDK